MNAPTQTRMTVDAFLAWSETWGEGERWELYRGVPFRMSPERSRHALVKSDVDGKLKRAIAQSGLPLVALPDGMTVPVGGRTAFEPDAVIAAEGSVALEQMTVDAPVAVVEVLSPTTRGLDTGRKLVGYFGLPSLHHYLVINTDEKCVTHHARRGDGRLETAIVGAGMLRLDPPGLAIDVAAFFARV